MLTEETMSVEEIAKAFHATVVTDPLVLADFAHLESRSR